MKNVLRVLIIAAFVTAFASAALAQGTGAAAAQASPAQASPCTTDVDAKAALYDKFLKNYKGTPDQQKIASEAGKEYLSKYGACPDESDKKIAAFIQNWSTKYDKAVRDFACTDAYNKKDYARTFQACQAILSAEPDNIDTVLLLARAGYANVSSPTPNNALNADAVRMTRRAVEMIESGKAPSKWDPFPSKDEALGFLYYAQGVFARETSPADAAAAFIKAAQSNSTFAKESSTYTYLATIYRANELKKLAADYSAAFPPNVPIPDEKKAQYDQMVAQLGKVQDRIIDAYARAAALLKADPKANPTTLKQVMTELTDFYKLRHENSEAGLQELIAGVMNKPLMLPGHEPEPATPANSSSAVTGTDGVVKPAATAPQPAATNGAKPAATTTPAPANGVKPAPKPQSKTTTKPAAKAAATTSGH